MRWNTLQNTKYNKVYTLTTNNGTIIAKVEFHYGIASAELRLGGESKTVYCGTQLTDAFNILTKTFSSQLS